MSHPLSFPKIVHPVSLLLAGIVGSVLVTEALPNTDRPQNLQQIATPIEEVQEVNGAAVLGIAALGSAGIGVTLTALHERNRRSPQPKAFQPSKANPKLQRQLLRLLHEDRQAAERLVSYARLKYPGHNADWYVEKVIYDLKRDRH
jgi:hypothetical protein